MPKCRDNRRKKSRHRARFVRQMVTKLVGLEWHSRLCPDGKNPDYYEPYDVRFLAGSSPHWSRLTYKVRPNAKYQAMIKELAEKCKGVTIDLSQILRGESGPVSTKVEE